MSKSNVLARSYRLVGLPECELRRGDESGPKWFKKANCWLTVNYSSEADANSLPKNLSTRLPGEAGAITTISIPSYNWTSLRSFIF